MVDKRRRMKVRQLVVPLALTVSVVASAVAVATSTIGCDDKPSADAGIGDGMPDTPII